MAARSFEIKDPRPFGFDAAVQFPPHQIPASRINEQMTIINPQYIGNIYSYDELAMGFASENEEDYALIKTAAPSWDNEARKLGAGHTFFGSSPERYGRWLREIISQTREKVDAGLPQPPMVFVNAWNESAEGAHLEPDRRHGYAFLHATAAALESCFQPYEEAEKITTSSQRSFEKRSDSAIVVHLFHADLYDEIRVALLGAYQSCDIFFSVRLNAPDWLASQIKADFPNTWIETFQNRGRDIYPFLKMLSRTADMGYDFLCKIHTKKSPQRSDGNALRRSALTALLPYQTELVRLKCRMHREVGVGIFAPPNSLIDLAEADKNVLNRTWLDRLLPKLGAPELVGNYKCHFVAGSMYWARVNALKPLLELGLKVDDFEDEAGQFDGTLAHAIERLTCVSAKVGGYSTSTLEN